MDVYSDALEWGYDTEIFAEKGIGGPKCWADLLEAALQKEIPDMDPTSTTSN
ncbi:hypothetical protein [Jannaschia rubra]|uniref:hypothetical protein n=1 Tax=Jannaschia rubra TaxID=282197 RepID=UPI000A72BC84|nr:hypothetical protein [Jannaschia rubra]